MTLSNFDWTDKQSLKWFIMLPTGHEGPYSLDTLTKRLQQNKLARDVVVWSEGLVEPITLQKVLAKVSGEEESGPPPLPPLPTFAGDELPPLPPIEEVSTPSQPSKEKGPSKKWPFALLAIVLLVGLAGFGIYQWIKEQEKFEIRRYPKMSVEVHSRIMNSMQFQGWGKPIFFKEFVPIDLSHIWLVTSSYQHCKVDAEFGSMKDKLLTIKDSAVKFRTKGILDNHVVELTRFEFSEGTKIVPGLYEMHVRAYDCEWDGIVPKLANKFKSPDATYEATMKVVLFEKGAEEFNHILDELNAKKLAKETREKNQQAAFWDDLQQKFQTLQAVTLQIEQLLLDFVGQPPGNFPARVRTMVANYTRQYGHFLTNFVVANEKYFQEISQGELRPLTLKKNYEEMIRLTSKKIGQSAMVTIEELQKLKRPADTRLQKIRAKILKDFSGVKDLINSRLIEVTEDRSQKP